MGCTPRQLNVLFLLGIRAGCRTNGRVPISGGRQFSKALIRLKVRCVMPRGIFAIRQAWKPRPARRFREAGPRLAAGGRPGGVRWREFRPVSGRLHFGEPGAGRGTDHQVNAARSRARDCTHRFAQLRFVQGRLVHGRRVTHSNAQTAAAIAAGPRYCRGRPAPAAHAPSRPGRVAPRIRRQIQERLSRATNLRHGAVLRGSPRRAGRRWGPPPPARRHRPARSTPREPSAFTARSSMRAVSATTNRNRVVQASTARRLAADPSARIHAKRRRGSSGFGGVATAASSVSRPSVLRSKRTMK